MSDSIIVQTTKPIGTLRRSWRFIGFDECNYAVHPDGKALLSEFGALPDAPYHVRVHHLLCNGNLNGERKWGSTNVYDEDTEGKEHFDWTMIDNIFDSIINSGNEPFIELGFMPFDLADPSFSTGDSRWSRYAAYRREGWASPPKSLKKWTQLIEALVRHCVSRYGQHRVENWYWELWNEPDLDYYWKGSLSDFCCLYDATELAVHSVLPAARLGGPATTGPVVDTYSLEFLRGFLRHCQENNTRIDFVSFHAKGGGFPFDPQATEARPSVSVLLEQVKTGLDALAEAKMLGTEVVVSEADPDGWAAGGRFDNPNMEFRNTEYYASYVAAAYAGISSLSEQYGSPVHPLAWAFMFPDDRCFEGTRVFSSQGILKPVFRLFQMYSQMGSQALAVEEEVNAELSVCAARSETDELTVLVGRHVDHLGVAEPIDARIEFHGLLPGKMYKVQHFVIDDEHTNPVAEWERLGRPDFPNSDEHKLIKSGDALFAYPAATASVSSAGIVEIDVKLKRHAACFLKLLPQ